MTTVDVCGRLLLNEVCRSTAILDVAIRLLDVFVAATFIDGDPCSDVANKVPCCGGIAPPKFVSARNFGLGRDGVLDCAFIGFASLGVPSS